MANSLIKYLTDQPLMRVVRGLLLSSKPRHIRDLAGQYSLSPSGVSDIVRRLKQAGVLEERRQGNKRCFRLKVSSEELKCLESFYQIFDAATLEDRAPQFSKNAAKKLEWMDDTYAFYRKLKRDRDDSAQNS